MRKAFWKGFRDGFSIMFPYVLVAVVFMAIGYAIHPYEQCKRMYDTPEDVSECVWIKENP